MGRIIIDGVVDSEDYYAGELHGDEARTYKTHLVCVGLWSNNLRDTDAALFDIYQSCVHAGPKECPMYEANAERIAERIDKLLTKIKAEPIPFLTIGGGGASRDTYGLIDYTRVRAWIFSSLYTTHGGGGKFLMSILAQLERGVMLSLSDGLDFLFACHCSEPDLPWDGNTHSLAIACGDAPSNDETLEESRALYVKMAQNTSFSDVWPIHLYCT